MPAADEILKAGDSILTMTVSSPVDTSTHEISGHRDVVIIDDNPVIIKLYTRLFQKASFIPHTAAEGTSGLALIEQIRPTAAVIDFMLPVFSGIGTCSRIRKNKYLDRTRLILFTADDNAATRARAMDACADAEVVKSSDAHEVIETVVEFISKNQD